MTDTNFAYELYMLELSAMKNTMLDNLYIPDNEFGIAERYYTTNEVVELLRDNCNKPDVIYFIADMMEV